MFQLVFHLLDALTNENRTFYEILREVTMKSDVRFSSFVLNARKQVYMVFISIWIEEYAIRYD